MNQEIQDNQENSSGIIPEIVGSIQPNEIVIKHKHELVLPDKLGSVLPDLEKGNPGFTKRVTENFLDLDKEFRRKRNRFGMIQSYTSLVLAIIFGVVGISSAAYIAVTGMAMFWNTVLIGYVLLLAVGKDTGIAKIIDAVSKRVKKY